MGRSCGASREGVIEETIELGERIAEAEQRVVEELDEIHASVEQKVLRRVGRDWDALSLSAGLRGHRPDTF